MICLQKNAEKQSVYFTAVVFFSIRINTFVLTKIYFWYRNQVNPFWKERELSVNYVSNTRDCILPHFQNIKKSVKNTAGSGVFLLTNFEKFGNMVKIRTVSSL